MTFCICDLFNTHTALQKHRLFLHMHSDPEGHTYKAILIYILKPAAQNKFTFLD